MLEAAKEAGGGALALLLVGGIVWAGTRWSGRRGRPQHGLPSIPNTIQIRQVQDLYRWDCLRCGAHTTTLRGAAWALDIITASAAGHSCAASPTVGGRVTEQRGSNLGQALPPAIRPVRMSRPTSTGLPREDER